VSSSRTQNRSPSKVTCFIQAEAPKDPQPETRGLAIP
jgi:hypothetical protein